MSARQNYAMELHEKGYNCAQAVACSFCKDFGVEEEEMCGALSGMMMIMGLAGSVGNPEKGPITKGRTYKTVKNHVLKFKEKNGSYLCRELKGVDTGVVLCSCPQCIRDAVALTEEYLKEWKK